MPGLTNVREQRVETPFGEPSDAFIVGDLEGRKVAFLARGMAAATGLQPESQAN